MSEDVFIPLTGKTVKEHNVIGERLLQVKASTQEIKGRTETHKKLRSIKIIEGQAKAYNRNKRE